MPAKDEYYLHAAGREDIDVRMLGTGRPFVFEFVNPRRAISCHNGIEELKVNGEFVRCPSLKIVDMKFFDHLKEIESQKAKRYAAVVWLNREITDKDIETLNSV
jgi:tRNA pseudouridine synthase 10